MLNLQNMAKKDTGQFNLRPPRQVINRLAELAQRFNRDGATQVAVEVLQEYTELWAEAEQAKRAAIEQQQAAMRRAIQAEMLKFPIKNAATESAGIKAHGRKTK